MEDKVEDIEQLVSYIKDLKAQLGDAYEEIQYIREAMESIKDQTVKVKLEKCITAAGEQIEKAEAVYRTMKNKVYRDIENAVQNVKIQGIRAVDKAVDVLHVRKALESIGRCLNKAALSLGEGMRRLDMAQKEVVEIKGHIGNFTRAMTGRNKEVAGWSGNSAETVKQNDDRGVLLDLQKPLSFCKQQVEGMEKKTAQAVQSVEHFHQLVDPSGQSPAPAAGKEKVPKSQMPRQR